MKQHLTWWKTNLQETKGMRKFRKNCGSFNVLFKSKVRKHIESKGYISLLDCGAGLCTEYYGFKEDGYDINYYAIDITQILVEEGQKQGINITLQNIDKLSFEDNKFDVCICYDTLNHQENFEPLIKEMLRVAKKEVIISFFKNFSDSDDNIIQQRCFDSENKCNLIYNFFSKKRVDEFLEKSGLRFLYEEIGGRSPRTILYIKAE